MAMGAFLLALRPLEAAARLEEEAVQRRDRVRPGLLPGRVVGPSSALS